MKKAFDQTVRDLKREVNKKVLKVPSIEQKVLDATSNEPWGPHGLLLADIAQASKNYHDYQMLMGIIWKRVNDTGKNWRHVYKALTVLEYLVANGSERVIDEIREHAYQISTLSDFQYIDSNGRDQGNNVRKKSQSLVVLVNDKERIQEVRQKAAANKDKFRNTTSGSYSSSGGYGDRRDDYEGRYGRDRDPGNRDDDRYGRYGDSPYEGREGDKYSTKDYEERYSRDDEYRGRGQSNDDYHYESRSKSVDRYRDSGHEDDGRYSSRGSGAKADDHSQDGSTTSRGLDRKYSDQNIVAPPSYEEAVSAMRSPTYSDRDGESSAVSAAAPKAASPPADASPSHATTAASPPQPQPSASPPPVPATDATKKMDGFDEFDPRGSFSAAPVTNNIAPSTAADTELDFLGSLALVPVTQSTMTSEANVSTMTNHQPFADPFGDGPFRAAPTYDAPSQQNVPPQAANTYNDSTYTPASGPPVVVQTNTQILDQEIDILSDILPPASQTVPQTGFPPQTNQPPLPSYQSVPSNQTVPQTGFPPQTNQPPLPSYQSVPSNQTVPQTGFPPQTNQPPLPSQNIPQNSFQAQTPLHTQIGSTQTGFQSNQQNPNFYGGYPSQPVYTATANMGSQMGPPASTGSLAIVPQPPKDKFETKSTVWADTLSRGLVNLNISGSKTNPLADIGVDFDAINRKDKRMEKPTNATPMSTITMGKAMGSGSGMGRAGAGALRPAQNPMVGPGMPAGMGMGMGMGMGTGTGTGISMGMGMGGGQFVNQQMTRGPANMGMAMNTNMGQGMHMQHQTGYPPGSSTVPQGYNPMTGTNNYSQQPYGRGHQ